MELIKVNPSKINFAELKKIAKQKNLIAIRFDVPFMVKDSQNEKYLVANKQMNTECSQTEDSAFTRYDILQNIDIDEPTLLNNIKGKTRYNINYAIKKGVSIIEVQNDSDFDKFYDLLIDTSKRQNYGIRDKKYYKLLFDKLVSTNSGAILIAKHEQDILAAWFLSFYDEVGYYMYGASNVVKQNFQASSLLAFEAMKLAQKKGCKLFDFWGVDKDLSDKNSKYYGVTRFKLGFGGEVIEYMDSYDLVLKKPFYYLFIILFKVRQKFITLKKKVH